MAAEKTAEKLAGKSAEKLTVEQVAAIVAQQNAMEGQVLFLPHGSRLFTLDQGWETASIAAQSGVAQADSMLTLDEAMRDAEVKVIFIPASARLSDADIEKVCQRNGATKTLFREATKA